MKWRDLDKEKPKDQEMVLCFHPYTGPGRTARIHLGRYHKKSDRIAPDSVLGFEEVRWWMPLPAFPRSKNLLRE